MKLTELEPRWAQSVLMNREGRGQSNFAPAGFVNGLTFRCPCENCRATNSMQRLGVTFEPPFGPLDWLTPSQPITDSPKIWHRDSGETFETLTLSPSIDTSVNPAGRIDFKGHWHGYIKFGEIA